MIQSFAKNKWEAVLLRQGKLHFQACGNYAFIWWLHERQKEKEAALRSYSLKEHHRFRNAASSRKWNSSASAIRKEALLFYMSFFNPTAIPLHPTHCVSHLGKCQVRKHLFGLWMLSKFTSTFVLSPIKKQTVQGLKHLLTLLGLLWIHLKGLPLYSW